jgi:ADP-ribosylglycohydrolase
MMSWSYHGPRPRTTRCGTLISMVSRADRLRGGIYGLLVGDALGVPYEFRHAAELPAEIEMDPPDWFRRAHASVRPGTWSDDGAQALALLASLLDHPSFDADDFGRRLVNWLDWGYMAVGDRVFDVGIQTRIAIDRLREGMPALEAGPSEERRNGNGSLMRVLPVALVTSDDAELVRIADASSRVTHGHARSRVCCALYVLWARRILDGHDDAWADAVRALRGTLAAGTEEHDALENHVCPDAPAVGRGSGYVIDTLRSARMCIERHATYEDAVRAAVALGDDTDTTAAVVGGIAGLREGIDAIPMRWRDALHGREIVDPLMARLLASL